MVNSHFKLNMDLVVRAKSNRICCVPQCSHRAVPGTSLHSFPNEKSDKARRLQWIHSLKIGKSVSKNFKVCCWHFQQEDFFEIKGKKKDLFFIKFNVFFMNFV